MHEEEERLAKEEFNAYESTLKFNKERLELLLAVHVHVLDELGCLAKQLIECVYKDMNEFRGKIFIGLGDWKQFLSVIKEGSKHDILSAALFNSFLWAKFKRFRLHTNMRILTEPDPVRQRLQTDFATTLQAIGTNTTAMGLVIEAPRIIDVTIPLLPRQEKRQVTYLIFFNLFLKTTKVMYLSFPNSVGPE